MNKNKKMNKNIKLKIVIAPNAFKESLSSKDAAQAIYKGFLSQFPDADIQCVPLADGGEGTLDCLVQHQHLKGKNFKGKIIRSIVQGPRLKKVTARMGLLQDKAISTGNIKDKTKNNTKKNNYTAIIEMAEASGLALLNTSLRNPLKTTTFGTGELIKKALNMGARKIIIGLGNSATVDAGIGALAALGVQFKDASGKKIPLTGEGLNRLKRIDFSRLDKRLVNTKIIAACDVDNKLIGKNGAIQYAAQKGATLKQIKILEKGLKNFDNIVSKVLHKRIGNIPGAGAAGGLAAGLLCLNAELQPGASFIMQSIHFEQLIKDADLIISGEGQVDKQTLRGKLPAAIGKLAKRYAVPVIVLAGNLGAGYDKIYSSGVTAVFSIATGPMSREDCIKQAKFLLQTKASNIARLLASMKF